MFEEGIYLIGKGNFINCGTRFSIYQRDLWRDWTLLRPQRIVQSANKSLSIYAIEKNSKDSDLIYLGLTLTHHIFTQILARLECDK